MSFDLSPRASSRLHDLLGWAKLPALECWAARHLKAAWPRLRISFVAKERTGSSHHVMTMRKRCGRIDHVAADLEWMRSRPGFSSTLRRIGVFTSLLSDPMVPDGDWWIDIGDAVQDEGPFLGFCTPWRETILVPDRRFVTTHGYDRDRRAGRAAPPFEDRDPEIVWRGGPSGSGALLTDPMDASSPALRQRVRLCLRLRDRPRSGPEAVDVRIARGRAVAGEIEDRYRAAGILGEFIPPQTWCRRRFAIDIDGYANAFSNFFIRLLYGCCVIRVASPGGFRQWYHDRLEPGRHYVPAAADLSDIDAVIDWCRSHPADCGAIARAGQQAVMDMTFSGEMRHTVESIRRHGGGFTSAAMAATSAAS